MKNKALCTKINEIILEDYFKQMWRLQENQVKFCAVFNSFEYIKIISATRVVLITCIIKTITIKCICMVLLNILFNIFS